MTLLSLTHRNPCPRSLAMAMAIVVLLVGCGLRSPGPGYEYYYTSKAKPSRDQVVADMRLCGYYLPSHGQQKGELIDNARARAEECMFNKGYFLKDGDSGICSRPDYRRLLPVCATAPMRPSDDYYGQ